MSCILKCIDWGQCKELESMDDILEREKGNSRMFKVLLGISIAAAILAIGAVAVAFTVTLTAAYFWALLAAAGVALLIHGLSLAALWHNHQAEEEIVYSRRSVHLQDVTL